MSVRALAKRGYRIRVADPPARPRRPSAAARQCRADPAGAGQCARALVGRPRRRRRRPCRSTWSASCFESGRQNFGNVQDFGARAVAEAARAGKARLTHLLGARRRSAVVVGLCAHQGARREGGAGDAQGRGDLAAVDRVRPGGPFLQSLRRHGAAFAGAAADRRRPHALPAGLCRRRRRGDRPLGRRRRSRAAGSTSSAGRRC